MEMKYYHGKRKYLEKVWKVIGEKSIANLIYIQTFKKKAIKLGY